MWSQCDSENHMVRSGFGSFPPRRVCAVRKLERGVCLFYEFARVSVYEITFFSEGALLEPNWVTRERVRIIWRNG